MDLIALVFSMWQLAVIFALAFLVETLVEFIFGVPFDKFPQLTPYKWCLMYVALAAGVSLNLFYRVDLIALIKSIVGQTDYEVTVVGLVLTGLAVGRGSNYLHDFVQKFFPHK